MMSRTDSSGQDGLREAVEAVRAFCEEHRHQWRPSMAAAHIFTFDGGVGAAAQDVLALLADHPATPTEETADLTGPEQMAARALAEEVVDEDRDADRRALEDWMIDNRWGYEAYDFSHAILASGWLRDHDAALTANAKAEAWWQGHLDGCEDGGRLDAVSHREMHYPLNPYAGDDKNAKAETNEGASK